MAEEKVYLSPTDNNPLLKVEKEEGVFIYRDQSTGEEYSQEYIDENGKTREDLFPADQAEKAEKSEEELAAEKAAKEAKAKARAEKKAKTGPTGSAGNSGPTGSEEGASGASGASGPQA